MLTSIFPEPIAILMRLKNNETMATKQVQTNNGNEEYEPSDFEAQILCLRHRNRILPLQMPANRRDEQPGHELPSPANQVSSRRAFPVRRTTDNTKSSITAKIIQETRGTWQGLLASSRTREFVNQATATTYSSFDEHVYDRSTPSPGGDSHTDVTSGYEVEGTGVQRKEQERAEALQKENEVLRMRCTQLDASFGELDEKYAKLTRRRMIDKARVEEAWEVYQESQASCTQLEEKIVAFQVEYNELEQQRLAQLEATSRRVKELKKKHEVMQNAAKEIFLDESVKKNHEVQEAKLLVQTAGVAAARAAADELQKYKQIAENEMRRLIDATENIRQNFTANAEKVAVQVAQTRADCDDAMAANNKSMITIVKKVTQLRKENRTMCDMLKQRYPHANELRHVIHSNDAGKQEVKNLRDSNRRLTAQVENLIDKEQQIGDHLTTHRNRQLEA